MQNRYVGDVGDFGKFGLLRYLSGHTANNERERLRVGVLWYFHHDEVHVGNNQRINADGRHISFLRRTATDDKAEYRNCDPGLWEGLRDLVYRDGRCLCCAERAGLLPEDTQYYRAPLVFLEGSPPQLRRQMRTHWWRRCLRATADAQLVCLDPDNGIAGDENLKHRDKGTKYTYHSDLADLWNRGQSLVVYHHLGRTDADAYSLQKALELSEASEGNPEVFPLIFNKGTLRVFFVIPRPEHREVIRERVDRMLAGPWNRHFRLAGEGAERPRPAPRQPRAGANLFAEVDGD